MDRPRPPPTPSAHINETLSILHSSQQGDGRDGVRRHGHPRGPPRSAVTATRRVVHHRNNPGPQREQGLRLSPSLSVSPIGPLLHAQLRATMAWSSCNRWCQTAAKMLQSLRSSTVKPTEFAGERSTTQFRGNCTKPHTHTHSGGYHQHSAWMDTDTK